LELDYGRPAADLLSGVLDAALVNRPPHHLGRPLRAEFGPQLAEQQVVNAGAVREGVMELLPQLFLRHGVPSRAMTLLVAPTLIQRPVAQCPMKAARTQAGGCREAAGRDVGPSSLK
jgi:hypothetical protein